MSRSIVLAAPILLSLGGGAHADSWAWPEERTIASPSGAFRLKVTPGKGEGRDSAAALSLARTGARVYERRAVNSVAPVDVLVGDDGTVVTLGDWHSVGYDHSLVIYDPAGALVIDRRLEEILTARELTDEVARSVSSRWWLKPDRPPVLEPDELVLTTLWGEELRFRLRDGAQLRSGRLVAIPTDEQRYADYARGARRWRSATVKFGEADAEGGLACTMTPRTSRCEPYGKTRRRAVTARYDRKAFERALRTTLPFAAIANTEWVGALPGPHWFIDVTFDDGYPYTYNVLVPRSRAAGKDVTAAAEALRRLARVR